MTGPPDEYAAIARLYDYVTPYAERPDVGFYVRAAQDAGSPILEIGSGTGRILIPTARLGLDIVGLDASPGMISVCRERLEVEPDAVRRRVELTQGDMRTFDLGRTFSLVTIPFRPFQHLETVDDQLACLKTIHRHLKSDGRLIFDLFNPSLDALANRPVGPEFADEPEFSVPDGRRVVRRHRIVSHDRPSQVNQVELIYYVTHPDGRKERLVHAFPMRYLFRFEVEHLLARAGFEVEHLYSSWDKSPFGTSYPGELIFVARPAGPLSSQPTSN